METSNISVKAGKSGGIGIDQSQKTSKRDDRTQIAEPG